MVRIRLTRTGRKNAPSYRIIVTDSKSKRDGKHLELIGYYNPTEDDKKVEYKKDRYEYWLSVGAQPSKAVKKLIEGKYVYKPYNRNESEEEADTETEIEVDTDADTKPEAQTETAKTDSTQDNQEETAEEDKASDSKDK